MKVSSENKGIFDILDLYSERLENFIMGLGLITTSMIVFVNIVTRYFFDFSLRWSEELSRYIIVWVTFFGVSSCARFDEHVKVDLIPNKLKGKAKHIQSIIVNLLCLGTAVYLAFISIMYTIKQYVSGNKSVAIAIPIWVIYISAAIGFTLLSYTYIRKLMKILAHEKEGVL